MDVDSRLLHHARALAEAGSFARAARARHLTRPALSRSIQALARRTRLNLFYRDIKRVEPTDLGRRFVANARAAIVDADHAAVAVDRSVAAAGR